MIQWETEQGNGEGGGSLRGKSDVDGSRLRRGSDEVGGNWKVEGMRREILGGGSDVEWERLEGGDEGGCRLRGEVDEAEKTLRMDVMRMGRLEAGRDEEKF